MSQRSYSRLAAAIIIAAVIISATLFASSVFSTTITKTATRTDTTTIAKTTTQTSTSTRTVTGPTTTTTDTATITSTRTMTTTTTTVAVSPCGDYSKLLAINGSAYCATDVSKDIVVQDPGYSYFPNGPITFMGVKFQTVCPASFSGCPGSKGNSTVMYISAISIIVTSPDKTNETMGDVIGDSQYLLILSRHADPKAGVQIQYIPGLYATGASTSNYRVLLLVNLPSSTSTLSIVP